MEGKVILSYWCQLVFGTANIEGGSGRPTFLPSCCRFLAAWPLFVIRTPSLLFECFSCILDITPYVGRGYQHSRWKKCAFSDKKFNLYHLMIAAWHFLLCFSVPFGISPYTRCNVKNVANTQKIEMFLTEKGQREYLEYISILGFETLPWPTHIHTAWVTGLHKHNTYTPCIYVYSDTHTHTHAQAHTLRNIYVCMLESLESSHWLLLLSVSFMELGDKVTVSGEVQWLTSYHPLHTRDTFVKN